MGGTWFIDIETILGSDTCSGDATFVVEPGAETEVAGEGTCYFPEDGWVSSLIAVGLLDDLGPYGGDINGNLTSDTEAAGTVPIDLLDGEVLSIDWSGFFSGDTFTGEVEGTETIELDATGSGVLIPLEIDFEGEFVGEKVVVEEGG